MKDFRSRMNRLLSGDPIKDYGRNIFELKSDHIHGIDKLCNCRFIGVRPSEFAIGNLSGWAIRRGLIGMNPVTYAAGGNSKHSAKLAAAEYSNGRTTRTSLNHLWTHVGSAALTECTLCSWRAPQ